MFYVSKIEPVKETEEVPFALCDDLLLSLYDDRDYQLAFTLLACQICFNSEENLRAALTRMRVGNRALEDVIDKVRNRHYQVGV